VAKDRTVWRIRGEDIVSRIVEVVVVEKKEEVVNLKRATLLLHMLGTAKMVFT
jgi:hypothetical protein